MSNLYRNMKLHWLIIGFVGLQSCAPAEYKLADDPLNSGFEEGSGIPGSQPQIGFPGIGKVATVTFEDNYPNAGDGDYNDFISLFRITEHVNTLGQLTKIEVDFIPKARSAAFDHRFFLVLDGKKDAPTNLNYDTTPLFNGTGRIRLDHKDGAGNVISTQDNLSKDNDLVIFDRTAVLFKDANGQNQNWANSIPGDPLLKPAMTAHLTIDIDDPAANTLTSNRISISRYRMVLRVLNTSQDIDLVDVNKTAIDANGLPYGFVVPTDWRHPLDQVHVDAVYPYFKDYRQYLSDLITQPDLRPQGFARDWYDRPAANSAGKIFDEGLFTK